MGVACNAYHLRAYLFYVKKCSNSLFKNRNVNHQGTKHTKNHKEKAITTL